MDARSEKTWIAGYDTLLNPQSGKKYDVIC